MQFKDSRLAYVRSHYEERVVTRFIENYVQGNAHCTALSDTGDGENRTITVFCQTDKKTYMVKDWKCECMEMERTGVSCSHVIVLATLTGERLYEEMISRRWYREAQARRQWWRDWMKLDITIISFRLVSVRLRQKPNKEISYRRKYMRESQYSLSILIVLVLHLFTKASIQQSRCMRSHEPTNVCPILIEHLFSSLLIEFQNKRNGIEWEKVYWWSVPAHYIYS